MAFRLTELQIESTPDCSKDFVQIGSPTTGATGNICGVSFDYGANATVDWFDNWESDYEENYPDYFQRNYPSEFFQWTALDSSQIAISYFTTDEYSFEGFEVEFQCVEDLVHLPECSSVDTAFGEVNFELTAGVPYENSQFSQPSAVQTSNVRQADCAKSCFEQAGCSSYYFENDECHFIIGSPAALPVSSSVTDSGRLSDFCPEDDLYQFEVDCYFYCAFSNAGQADSFIADLSGTLNVSFNDLARHS